MRYPAMDEVEAADHEQLARWWRFLPISRSVADARIIERVTERFQRLGGMNPALSKRIGWDEPRD